MNIEIARLREKLRWITAKYDDGALPPGVYAVVQKLQREIAWAEQAAAQESAI